MNPTAVSQVIEALGKLILGLCSPKFTMDHGMNNFKEGKRFSAKWSRLRRRLAAPYPYAAAPVAGVTIGVFALGYLILRHRLKRTASQGYARSRQSPCRSNLTYQLIGIAIPVVASTIIMNLTNFIDSWSIQFRLSHAIASNEGLIRL